MSATRRAYAGDDNILARLERDAKRGKSGKSGPWKHARLAWCMLASVLVIGLIGVLATLARENMTVPKPAALAESGPAEAFGNSVRGGFAPLPVPAPHRKLGANVFDVPAEPALLAPMVMLKPAPAAAKSAAKAAAPAPAPAPAVRAAAVKPAKKPPERLAASARPVPVRAAAAVRPPAPPPRIAATPARQKKPAPAVSQAAEPAAVDNDVALLSAIIMHASRHSAERAQMEAARCGAGKKCPPGESFPSLKATD